MYSISHFEHLLDSRRWINENSYKSTAKESEKESADVERCIRQVQKFFSKAVINTILRDAVSAYILEDGTTRYADDPLDVESFVDHFQMSNNEVIDEIILKARKACLQKYLRIRGLEQEEVSEELIRLLSVSADIQESEELQTERGDVASTIQMLLEDNARFAPVDRETVAFAYDSESISMDLQPALNELLEEFRGVNDARNAA